MKHVEMWLNQKILSNLQKGKKLNVWQVLKIMMPNKYGSLVESERQKLKMCF